MGKKHVDWEVFVELPDGTIDATWTVKAPTPYGKVFERKLAEAQEGYTFPKPPVEYQNPHGITMMELFSGWNLYDGPDHKIVRLYRLGKRLKNKDAT